MGHSPAHLLWRAGLTTSGTSSAEPFASSPVEFGKFIADYTEKWRKLIRTAGIKV
jgi:hypothetical protein